MRYISWNRISNALGSLPMSSGFMSRIVPSMPWGDLPSLHSPHPVIPSSVSTLTNIHGRHPASTIKVSILVIFIGSFLSWLVEIALPAGMIAHSIEE